MRKIKKVLIILVSFVLGFIVFTPKNYAYFDPTLPLLRDDEMGTYIQTELVMEKVKVNIKSEMVDFMISTGKTVTIIETRHYFLGLYIHSSYTYHYYENQFVEKVVTSKTLYNNIDSLIFMVSELERLSNKFNPNQDAIDNVLGYIRCINKKYYDGFLGNWDTLAGSLNKTFVNYVDENSGIGIKFKEYFAQFAPYDSKKEEYYYNSTIYGDVSSTYKTKNLYLMDPFNDNSYIDVIHMFASMDGIYNDTNNDFILGSFGNNHQRDLLSWLGDLHTFTKQIEKEEINVSNLPIYNNPGTFNSAIDFDKYVNLKESKFSEGDLLADIDSMNITKTFLDDKFNSVSIALSAYYNAISNDNSYKPNRYKMFLETVTLEVEDASSSRSIYEKFCMEVYMSMNLKENKDGILKNFEYYHPTMYLGFGLLVGSTTPTRGTMPSEEIRSYTAKLFTNYILGMASAPYPPNGR